MNSDALYSYCEAHGIETFRIDAPISRSMSAYIDNTPVVGIDERGMGETELTMHLAHEVGHCERMAFYNPATPLETRSRCEARANLWALHKLIPKESLRRALKRGITRVWELAEHFGVTEDFIRFAVWEYFDKQI